MTDAIDTLNKTQRVFARKFTGKRYDVGDKFGFMKTSIEYGLTHPEVGGPLREYILSLGKSLAAETPSSFNQSTETSEPTNKK